MSMSMRMGMSMGMGMGMSMGMGIGGCGREGGLPFLGKPLCRPGGRPPKSPFSPKNFSRKPAVFPFSTLQGVALSYRLKSRQERNLRGRRGSFRKGHRGSGAGCPAGGERGKKSKRRKRAGKGKRPKGQEAQSGRGKGKRPKGERRIESGHKSGW